MELKLQSGYIKFPPGPKILLVSENRSLDTSEEALSTGAGGYILKSDAASELWPAFKAVLEGRRFFGASLSGHDPLTRDTGGSDTGNRIDDNPYFRSADSATISEFLASVIDATAADFGNVQLFDSTDRVLTIAAQHGFERGL